MLKKKVTMVELPLWERVIPLVSGYLQAFACKDAYVAKNYQFEKLTTSLRTPREETLKHLLESDSDIYTFSCYVWNTARIRSLLPSLLEAKPEAQILLGGPQVMHHGQQYLDPRHENLILCNGEGEKTFSDLLEEQLENGPDLAKVRGLSFYRDQELITTESQERINDINEVPSPFLSGIFDQKYSISILETNRGCPFRCAFCYWGAHNNDKVYKFDEERIKDELTWLSRNEIQLIFIADANWGMLNRDIDLTQHIADCKESNLAPTMVYFSAAKNKPANVTRIIETLREAGVVISQPVSLQSLDAGTLAAIDRSNIKQSAYTELQANLTEKGINSYTELIWPLPGETLASFKLGIEKLCRAGAGTIIVYPHLLLHNTPIYNRREEYGFLTREVGGDAGEDEVIIETADVSRQQFEEGFRFFYTIHLLYNCRALFTLSSYLDRRGIRRYSELISDFSGSCDETGYDLARFWRSSISDGHFSNFYNVGEAVHMALHSHREGTGRLIHEFVSSQPWWRDPHARFCYEIDLLSKPHLYSNTSMIYPGHGLPDHDANGKRFLEYSRILEISDRTLYVRVPRDLLSLLEEFPWLKLRAAGEEGDVFRVDHRNGQYPHMETQGLEHAFSYCHGMILRIGNILPTWRRMSTAADAMAPTAPSSAESELFDFESAA
jgi:radical SAM superfamily enzyme YgiQ (UPF0313 family)